MIGNIYCLPKGHVYPHFIYHLASWLSCYFLRILGVITPKICSLRFVYHGQICIIKRSSTQYTFLRGGLYWIRANISNLAKTRRYDISVFFLKFKTISQQGSLLNLTKLKEISCDVTKWKHFPRYWPFVRGIHSSPVNFSTQRPVTRSFDVFFDLRLNIRLSKQSWGWWFQTLSHPLWRQYNVMMEKHMPCTNNDGDWTQLGVFVPSSR